MTKRTFWLSVAAAAAIALVVGGLFGWFVRGGWTADWVGAAGTWIGSLATVATIGWAVLAFRHDRRSEREQAAARQEQQDLREARAADQVIFECRGSGRSGQAMTVRVTITNGTSTPIEVRGVEVVEPAADFRQTFLRAPFVVGSGGTWSSQTNNRRIEVRYPDDYDVDHRVELPRSVLHYRIDGNSWRREPGRFPERSDG